VKTKLLKLLALLFAGVMFSGCHGDEKKEIITCKPENFKEKISSLESGGTYNVAVKGTVSNYNSFIKNVQAALSQDKSVKIYLDLSETEGLKTFNSAASNLLGISLPASIKELNYNSLKGKNLRYVDFPKGNQYYTVVDKNSIYNTKYKSLIAVLQTAKELDVPEGTNSIEGFVIYYLNALEKVSLPSTITQIQVGNFDYCNNLTSVTGKINTSSIYSIFKECPNLKLVDLRGSTFKDVDSCFLGLGKVQVKLPETVERIYSSFNGLADTEITLPKNVSCIIKSFEKTELSDIKLPENLKELVHSFNNCSKLKTIEFGENLELLLGGFDSCAELKSITLPASIKRITPECMIIGKDPVKRSEWNFNIDLEDKTKWFYMSEKRVYDLGVSYNVILEKPVESEILSSPEALGNFVNNLKTAEGIKENDKIYGDSYQINGIWKNGYDIYVHGYDYYR